jgi:predicted transcriptional regulator
MADSATLTITVDEALAARLKRLAEYEGVSVEAVAADAIKDVVDHAFDEDRLALPGPPLTQAEWKASLEEQLRRIEAGEEETYTHEEVMAHVRGIIAEARER